MKVQTINDYKVTTTTKVLKFACDTAGWLIVLGLLFSL